VAIPADARQPGQQVGQGEQGPTLATTPPAPTAGRTWRGRQVPRGMILPSRSQYHGTMFAFIAAAVAVTMAAAVLINKGVGPFPVGNLHTKQTGDQITVTGLVRNAGTHPGRARCVATWTTTEGGRQQTGVVQTQLIAADGISTVTIPLANLTVVPSDVAIDCK